VAGSEIPQLVGILCCNSSGIELFWNKSGQENGGGSTGDSAELGFCYGYNGTDLREVV